MNQEVKPGKVLSPSTPWTKRPVPGIEVADEQQILKATFTEPTIECPECHALVTRQQFLSMPMFVRNVMNTYE